MDADDNGDICLHASAPVAVIVDINGIADTGFSAFTNRRTDTRDDTSGRGVIGADRMLSVNFPEAVGGGTVLGQLTIDWATTTGFVTAYACADGVPRDRTGAITRSDLNFDGTITPVASNRLIVTADEAGDVCLFTSAPVAIVVDASATASAAAVTAFPNRRVDTRTPLTPPGPITPSGPEAVPLLAPLSAGSCAGRCGCTHRATRRRFRDEPADPGGEDRQLRPGAASVRARAGRCRRRGQRRGRHQVHRLVPLPTTCRTRPRPIRANRGHRPVGSDEPTRLRLLRRKRRRRRMAPVSSGVRGARGVQRPEQAVLPTRADPTRTSQPAARSDVCLGRFADCGPSSATVDDRPDL